MRKIRYQVAMSLDGFIAGPNGEAEWIEPDSEVDFPAIWAKFDTLLMGRRTYVAAVSRLGETTFEKVTTIVFSRTMKPQDYPRATLIPEFNATWAQEMKNRPGKDIWLMGGSTLFRAFLDAGCVDTVEVHVIPVLLGNGVPLLPPPYHPAKLTLTGSKVYRSGRVALTYDVLR